MFFDAIFFDRLLFILHYILPGACYKTYYLCSGQMCMITGGHNLGRVGIVQHRERHPGSFDIVHVKDSQGHLFATRLSNVFIIGQVSIVKIKFLVAFGMMSFTSVRVFDCYMTTAEVLTKCLICYLNP